jgi:hypothetical protein
VGVVDRGQGVGSGGEKAATPSIDKNGSDKIEDTRWWREDGGFLCNTVELKFHEQLKNGCDEIRPRRCGHIFVSQPQALNRFNKF